MEGSFELIWIQEILSRKASHFEERLKVHLNLCYRSNKIYVIRKKTEKKWISMHRNLRCYTIKTDFYQKRSKHLLIGVLKNWNIQKKTVQHVTRLNRLFCYSFSEKFLKFTAWLFSQSPQENIYDPIKHLWWNCFAKIVNGL